MGNMQSFNRATGLTSNSILDIFSMARIYGAEISISWDAQNDRYRIETRSDDSRKVQYILTEQFDQCRSDVGLANFVLIAMLESMRKGSKK